MAAYSAPSPLAGLRRKGRKRWDKKEVEGKRKGRKGKKRGRGSD